MPARDTEGAFAESETVARCIGKTGGEKEEEPLPSLIILILLLLWFITSVGRLGGKKKKF